MPFKNIFFLALMAALVAACDAHIDDQTIVTEEQARIVNPAPAFRDFIRNNKNHRVIIAIMDTGIDYNHPLLAENIHFKLDEKGEPVAAGWDYAGNDPWPAPYVARTNHFNMSLSEAERDSGFKMHEASLELLREHPELSSYFPIERSVDEEESEGTGHGTHVAGLASYDSPEIGLLGYRVIPMNISSGHDPLDEVGTTKKFAAILLKGLRRAIADGATVINMSLGITLESSSHPEKKAFFEGFQKDLLGIAEGHPDVIFVVAAGNDGKWIDGQSVNVLPCFIPTKNVICVSALTEGLETVSFSNVVQSKDVTTIFTWGDDILSTFPLRSCHLDNLDYSTIIAGEKARSRFAARAKVECAKDLRLKKMTGTSMASPIIAREVAKLKARNPSLATDEIKTMLFNSSTKSHLGDLEIWKFAAQRPSWYKGPTTKSRGITPNWNFFILRSHSGEGKR